MARGRGRRGGNQPPARPAAVSGPGALSQRTDGGPSQPIRTATGQDYGEAGTQEDLQRAAPLPAAAGAGSAPVANAPAQSGGGVQPSAGLESPFAAGPSRVIENPADSRVILPETDQAQDLLRALYRLVPSPDILRLLPDGP